MSEREYKELVLADYDRKMMAGQLPSELMVPTPGGLKAESVKICERRFDPKDELLLRSFFNQKDDAAGYRLAIQNSSADLFRPMVKFLKNRSINTTLKNINLLAWLIDFQPRPYHFNLKAPDRSDAPLPIPVEVSTEPGNEQSPAPPSKNKKMIIYALFFIAISLTGYFIIAGQTSQLTGHEGCMVWSGDHYQPVDCGQKRGSLPVLKLDTQKVEHFKRVNADTLTPRALGHVWYAKINGNVEFYSDSGLHPVDTNRRLLRLSSYILNKYIFHVADPR